MTSATGLGTTWAACVMQLIDDFASKGLRVFALCRGTLRGLSRQALGQLSQQQLEDQVEAFSLLGLLVLSNNLKEDSAETLAKLQQEYACLHA